MVVDYGLVMMVCSAISILSSSSIVFSFIILPSLRSKPYMTLVYYIAVSDLLSALGSVVGLPPSGSGACWFEGVVTNVFTLTSVMWTVVISLMMYSIVVYGKVLPLNWKYHVVCWGLPISLTFIPLATNVTYGSTMGTWCWLIPTAHSHSWVLVFWKWANFYAVIWGGVFVMFLVFIGLIYEMKTNVHVATKKVVGKVFRKLQLYPFIFILTWLIPCVNDVYISDHPGWSLNDNVAWQSVALILPCLQGFFTSVVFWSSNSDVRRSVIRFFIFFERDSSMNSLFSKASVYSSRGYDCMEDDDLRGGTLYLAAKSVAAAIINAPVALSDKLRGSNSKNPSDCSGVGDEDGNTIVSNNSRIKPGTTSSKSKKAADRSRPSGSSVKKYHASTVDIVDLNVPDKSLYSPGSVDASSPLSNVSTDEFAVRGNFTTDGMRFSSLSAVARDILSGSDDLLHKAYDGDVEAGSGHFVKSFHVPQLSQKEEKSSCEADHPLANPTTCRSNSGASTSLLSALSGRSISGSSSIAIPKSEAHKNRSYKNSQIAPVTADITTPRSTSFSQSHMVTLVAHTSSVSVCVGNVSDRLDVDIGDAEPANEGNSGEHHESKIVSNEETAGFGRTVSGYAFYE
jgi:hypothetical protein